jgi:hypothetical protein
MGITFAAIPPSFSQIGCSHVHLYSFEPNVPSYFSGTP